MTLCVNAKKWACLVGGPLWEGTRQSSIIHVFGSFSFHTHRLVSCVVSGMTNLLMGTELNSQQLEYVKIAQASGNSLV